MLIHGTEVKTIEQAFSLLTEEQQAHARRVADYTDAVFARATARELYIQEVRGRTELLEENRSYARESGLYHDIGKLMEGEEVPPQMTQMLAELAQEMEVEPPTEIDHTLWGAYLIYALYPRYRSMRTYHQRILTDGAADHHERMDGSGAPWHIAGKDVGYLGRIVAIADELDHRAMTLRSEDPIGDVLKELKKEAAHGKFDEGFVKCFSSCAVSLRRVFNEYRHETQALPQTEMWIRRKSGRPMELGYTLCRESGTDRTVWLAEMRFRDAKLGMLPYGEMKKLISSRKLGPQLGDYFLYELCDSLRRFEVCGAPTAAAAVELPETWYTRRGLAKLLQQILSDEEMSPERITLILPASLTGKPPKILTENRAACEALGLRFVTAAEAAQTLSAIDPVPRTEDEAAFNVAPTVPTPEPEPEQTPEPAPAAEPEELPDNSWNKYAASALEDDDDDDEDEASGESEAET